jgi:hypothetical protein
VQKINISPELLKVLRHVEIVESVGASTRIEGSMLFDREVEKVLFGYNTKFFPLQDVSLSQLVSDIIQLVEDRGRITIVDIIVAIGVPRRTIKKN